MFNKILLASDGSKHAVRAAEKAVALAKGNPGAFIEIVYVIDGSNSESDIRHSWNAMSIEQEQKDKLVFTEQKVKHAHIRYQVKVLHGEPGPSIIKYVNENGFDVCVIGSRGLNSLQEMVLGSVSHQVAKRVRCPVLIVK